MKIVCFPFKRTQCDCIGKQNRKGDSMPKIWNNMKVSVLKAIESVGNSASTMAWGANLKMQELNAETTRRKLMTDFPLVAFDLWQSGTEFPPQLNDMLTEIQELDAKINELRAKRFDLGKVEEMESTEDISDTEEGTSEECTAEDGTAEDGASEEGASEEATTMEVDATNDNIPQPSADTTETDTETDTDDKTTNVES